MVERARERFQIAVETQARQGPRQDSDRPVPEPQGWFIPSPHNLHRSVLHQPLCLLLTSSLATKSIAVLYATVVLGMM